MRSPHRPLVPGSVQINQEPVRYKLNFLNLPEDIQERIHSGELSYTKARQLTILTRDAGE